MSEAFITRQFYRRQIPFQENTRAKIPTERDKFDFSYFLTDP